MKVLKTKFSSYCCKGFAEGCRLCLKGEKLVLFIDGRCSRNCYYCSLSSKRKNKPETWANERKCKNIKEVIEEAKESNSKGAGITGGDPLLNLKKTAKYSKELKKKFGKKFHIHIYLPTRLVNEKNLKKLSESVDEVRFHPEFLIKNMMPQETQAETQKIKKAAEIFGKENTGIEMPMIPDKKKQIFQFIKKAAEYVGFVNLNEFEISETNFKHIIENYSLEKEGYVIKGSKQAGIWVLKKCLQERLKTKIHLCTAETKNWHQYKNRLLKHEILPYGKRIKEGTVRYFANYDSYEKLKKQQNNKKGYYPDKKKKRIILNPKQAEKLRKNYKIELVEEYPTYDGIETERWEI